MISLFVILFFVWPLPIKGKNGCPESFLKMKDKCYLNSPTEDVLSNDSWPKNNTDPSDFFDFNDICQFVDNRSHLPVISNDNENRMLSNAYSSTQKKVLLGFRQNDSDPNLYSFTLEDETFGWTLVGYSNWNENATQPRNKNSYKCAYLEPENAKWIKIDCIGINKSMFPLLVCQRSVDRDCEYNFTIVEECAPTEEDETKCAEGVVYDSIKQQSELYGEPCDENLIGGETILKECKCSISENVATMRAVGIAYTVLCLLLCAFGFGLKKYAERMNAVYTERSDEDISFAPAFSKQKATKRGRRQTVVVTVKRKIVPLPENKPSKNTQKSSKRSSSTSSKSPKDTVTN